MNTIITFVTLSSQNMTDSLICSIAYMIIPFVVFLALNICATKVAQTFMMGYGNYSQSLKLLLNYISILYSGFSKETIYYRHLFLIHLLSIGLF